MSTGWYNEIYRKVHLDYHVSRDLKNVAGNLDAEELARAYKAAHVQALCIFGKDGQNNCMYMNDVGHRHPHLQRDYLGEFSAALKRHGLRVMAYFHLGNDEQAVLAHPEAVNRNTEGANPWRGRSGLEQRDDLGGESLAVDPREQLQEHALRPAERKPRDDVDRVDRRAHDSSAEESGVVTEGGKSSRR